MKTILVTENEDPLRIFAVLVLKEGGYNILEAGSGEDAVAIWDQYRARHGRGIDLLFTDLQMPGMNGAELADILEIRQPGLRTLFTSGSLEWEQILEYRNPYLFLPKPYRIEGLMEAVKQALEPVVHPKLLKLQDEPVLDHDLDQVRCRLYSHSTKQARGTAG